MKDFIDEIIDKLGEDVLVGKTEKVEPISTGSLSLDSSIGIGGIPRGRITEIYGPEGSGKTSLALSIARSAIKQGLRVLYIDAEFMIDYDVVTDLLGESLPEGSLVILHPETAEDNLVSCEIGIRSGEFQCIILDSIGALAPEAEKKKELTDANVGLLPKAMSVFLRRNMYAIGKNKVALIFINQVRDQIGSYVKTFSTPGGHALKHLASLRIALSKGEDIKQESEIVGINVRFVVKKNKLSAPFRSFTIPLYFGKGIDSIRDAVMFSEMLGIISRKGSYYVFEGNNLGQGMARTIETLRNDPDTLDKIKELCYNWLSGDKIILLSDDLTNEVEEQDE